MKGTVALPLLLMLGDNMRKGWLDLAILYGQTHAVNGTTYAITAGLLSRNRPFLYSDEIFINDKIVDGSRNSFFSGHVATTAASSFFMAKVISDYNPAWATKNSSCSLLPWCPRQLWVFTATRP